MRILLVGDFSDNLDEGMKNIAKYIFMMLLKSGEDVDKINIKKFPSHVILKNIILKNKNYDIIHYFTAPTFSSFIILKLLKLVNRNSKTVISALHPKAEDYLSHEVKRRVISSLLKVDAILYQYNPKIYTGLAKKLLFFPNGVDTKRFSPVPSREKKIELREMLGLPKDKVIVLHVGHLSHKRNIGIFEKIQKMSQDIQVVIAGSTYLEKDIELYQRLKKVGCIVFTGYVPYIEQLYKAADIYVFPVPWKNSINMPLTVLEAMSTNLPVIALQYPGLYSLDGTPGLYFADNEKSLIEMIIKVKKNLDKLQVKTRDTILEWSWVNLASTLIKYYEEIIGGKQE